MQTKYRIIVRVREFFLSFSKDKLRLYSAQASYFTILSFVPFFILLLTLIQFTPLSEMQLLDIVNDIAPLQLKHRFDDFVNDIYNKSSVTLISITAVTAVWASGRAFAAITEGLNNIFHVHETRNYFIIRILSTFYTLGLMILIVLNLALIVFGNQLLKLLHISIPWLYGILSAILKFKSVYALGILTLFFMFMFKYIPNRKSSLVRELPGALFSAFGWWAFSSIYSLYIDRSSHFSSIYGGLTTLAFAMFWLYICMYILFIGAEISKFITPTSSKKNA